MTLAGVFGIVEHRVRQTVSRSDFQTFTCADAINPRNVAVPYVPPSEPIAPRSDLQDPRSKPIDGITHGITSGYARGCRCGDCRAANAAHSRYMRDRQRATRRYVSSANKFATDGRIGREPGNSAGAGAASVAQHVEASHVG
jgi:hypothetical protein